MKRKFLILTLCFTIIFSSLNYKRSYADSGVISLPILATVVSLAVGSNIVLSGNDDLYDIGYLFYDYVEKHNSLTWESVKLAFNSSVALLPNNLVSVKSEFLDIVKGFFDSTFENNLGTSMGYQYAIPFFPNLDVNDCAYESDYLSTKSLSADITGLEGDSFTLGLLDFEYSYLYSTGKPAYRVLYNGKEVATIIFKYGVGKHLFISTNDSNGKFKIVYAPPGGKFHLNNSVSISASNSISIPYNGGYTWDNVDSKTDDDKSVALPIPGNLGQLVGQGNSDFWSNTDNLVGAGDISIPIVSDPSISLDNTISFPNTNVDTDNPSIDKPDTDLPNNGLDIFPPWGGGIDFTPVTQSSFTEKFPFSLASDLKNILDVFDVEPIPPKFTVPILGEEVNLDLTEFNVWASIVRFFVLIGFIISLINITRKVIG